MPDSDLEKFQRLIQSATGGGGSASAEDVLWVVADTTAAVIDGVTNLPIAGAVNSSLQQLRGMTKKEDAMAPNPWFIWNQVDADDSSTATKAYMKHRGRMQLGSTVVSVGGAVASIGTYADVGAILQHGNATASTAAHLYKFHAISKGYKHTKTVSGWLDVIMRTKAAKAALRGGQLAAAAIAPIPWGGALAVSVGSALVASGAKLGIQLRFTTICSMTALELHWRVYQERKLLRIFGGSGGTGPANRILQELFVRRGATRIFGQHHVAEMVNEPLGWHAIKERCF